LVRRYKKKYLCSGVRDWIYGSSQNEMWIFLNVAILLLGLLKIEKPR
jgi:hypothetical protein